MKKLFVILCLMLFISCSNDENSNDSSSETIKIGNQIWQSKNLDVETYRDGTPIPQVTDQDEWSNLTTGAWCYYNNDPANREKYGKLYNWYAVAGIHDNDPNTPNKVLAPEGWHVPSDNEWLTLSLFLGGESVSGGKIKSTGTSLWESPNTGATNESKFNGLPGGYRASDFYYLRKSSHWWSSTSLFNNFEMYAWSVSANFESDDFIMWEFDKSQGYSVRCIKD